MPFGRALFPVITVGLLVTCGSPTPGADARPSSTGAVPAASAAPPAAAKPNYGELTQVLTLPALAMAAHTYPQPDGVKYTKSFATPGAEIRMPAGWQIDLRSASSITGVDTPRARASVLLARADARYLDHYAQKAAYWVSAERRGLSTESLATWQEGTASLPAGEALTYRYQSDARPSTATPAQTVYGYVVAGPDLNFFTVAVGLPADDPAFAKRVAETLHITQK